MIAYAREIGLFNTVIPTQIFAQFRNPKRDILSWLFSISRHTYFQYRKSRPPFCLNPEFRPRALYKNQPKKLTGSCHVDCVLKTTVTTNLYKTALYIAVTQYITAIPLTSQDFQLPYIFCRVDLYIAVTQYVTVILPFPRSDRSTQVSL